MRDDDCSTSSVATVVAAVPVSSQIRQLDGGTISQTTLVPAATHKLDSSGKSDSSSGSSGGGKDPKRDKEREERDEGVYGIYEIFVYSFNAKTTILKLENVTR